MSLISLLKILISSFKLECFYLFSRYNSTSSIGLQLYVTILKAYFTSLHTSTHSLSSKIIGNKMFRYYSLIHGSSFQSLSRLNFTPTSFPPFPDATPWLSLILISLPFSLFTTDNISLLQDTHSSILFHQPLFQSFIQHTVPLDLQVDTSIINPHHSIPEIQFVSSNTSFNNWSEMPFQDVLHITHIRTPHSLPKS